MRVYLAISGLFTLSASVIWGVNTLFLLDAGLDTFQVFVANAAFTAGMVLFEIPTGVVADTSGRRRSFLLSAARRTLRNWAPSAAASARPTPSSGGSKRPRRTPAAFRAVRPCSWLGGRRGQLGLAGPSRS
ncbi:MAG TPA: hypothetical protein VGJ86_03845 [Acidimicrobiales bacterium]